eukprot:1926340-Pyramimonas_sp.AAC.1
MIPTVPTSLTICGMCCLPFCPWGQRPNDVSDPVLRDAINARPLALADASCKALSMGVGLPVVQ